MSTRILIALSLLVAAATAAPLSYAAGKQKPRPTSVPYYGGIYRSKGLLPGHRYRLIVTSTGHVPFAGNGIENYTWVKNHQFGESSTAVQFKGTTPRSFLVSQPVPIKLNGWLIALTLSNNRNKSMSVRFVDLGVKK